MSQTVLDSAFWAWEVGFGSGYRWLYTAAQANDLGRCVGLRPCRGLGDFARDDLLA